MIRSFPRILLLLAAVFIAISCSDEGTNAPVTYSISGTVHQSGTGSAIAGADVIASRHDDGVEVGRTVTDATGAFLLKGLPAGPLDILVEAAGYAPVLYTSMDAKSAASALNNMSVQLSPADSCCSGSLTLTLKNSSGERLSDKAVLIKKGGQIIGDPRTNQDGTVFVDDLCPGDYSIRIAVDGYRVYEAVFTINASCEPVVLTAVLESQGSGCCDGALTVIVKDENGAAVSGAQVRVWKNGAVLHTAFTDATGTATFADLCQGKYGVDVLKTGVTQREFTFTVNENCDPVTKEIVVESLGCCSGVFTLVVRDANGDPVPGVKVLVKKAGTAVADPITDANGSIVVDGLCRGEYIFRASKDGYSVVEGSFAINSDCDPVTKEVIMTTNSVCCTGVLTVTVVDAGSNAVEGATVKLWKNGAVKKTATTNAQGVAVIDGICKGEYGVSVLKSGFQTREFQFLMGADCAPYDKTVTLEP
jgi:large repetitive protein